MSDALPEMQPVQSSNMKAIGYETGNLYVEFPDGSLWRYRDVPQNIYDEMRGSGSLGRYLHQFIKPNHPGEKIRGAKPAGV